MKALLVTFDKYPDFDAGAVRIHMFGKILSEAGYEVHVISMGPSTCFREIDENDGIKHLSFRGKSQNIVCKAIYYMLFALRLSLHLKRNNYQVVIHSQLDEICFKILQSYGIKTGSTVIYDCVEWFSESQFNNGRKSRVYRRNNRYNTVLTNKNSSVIAISKFLENHFINREIRVVRIPVIMDTVTTLVEKIDTDKIVIIYAGSPGKKDYLCNFIKAIDLLPTVFQKKMQYTVLGVNYDQLVSVCGIDKEVLDRVKDYLDVRGKVSRKEVVEAYSIADFSVLIRPADQRYSKAGFPTKFVESLCCSTPVICNLTSDLELYAIDDDNSVIISDIDPETIEKALERIIGFSHDHIDSMKRAARTTAINSFDYHCYSVALNEFINIHSDIEN